MDPRTRFFARMENERQQEDNRSDDNIDIEFSITESGRTVAHMVAESMRSSGGGLDIMDFSSVADSTRTADMFTESEREDLIRTLQDNDSASPPQSPPSQQTTSPRAQPRAIPVPQQQHASLLPQAPAASSQESSGSAFLSSVLNPTGAIHHTPLSHTPPMAASYEVSHFGKRARSGSVSGRLRSASEYLEERGLLDRQTKGILKDLIIIGDEELQQAIDCYEAGDPTVLEQMIHSGALQRNLPTDLDLLGDLDLDFLTMQDDDVGGGGNIEPIRTSHSDTKLPVDSVPSGYTTTTLIHPEQQQQRQSIMVSPQYDDDGIGDLEFAGDLVVSQHHAEYMQSLGPSIAASPAEEEANNLSDYEQRMRSNSVLNALLNDPPSRAASRAAAPQQPTAGQQQYGKWMDQIPSHMMQPSSAARRRVSAPMAPSGISASLLEAENKRRQSKTSKKQQDMQAEPEHVHIPGSGLPRSLSDPNLRTSLDPHGLVQVDRPEGWVGAYSPDSRKVRIERFLQKRTHRVWTKTVKYDVRKNFADSRLRVKGRFVKKEDELLMRELMSLT